MDGHSNLLSNNEDCIIIVLKIKPKPQFDLFIETRIYTIHYYIAFNLLKNENKWLNTTVNSVTQIILCKIR